MFNVEIEPPKKLTKTNVIYWNEDFKRLEGVTEANAIRTKAKNWIEHDCIDYDCKKKVFLCKKIEGYNKTTHIITKIGDRFECSCQFYNKIVKENLGQLTCSHILAVKLQISIWESEGIKHEI